MRCWSTPATRRSSRPATCAGSLNIPADGRFAETAGMVLTPDQQVVVVAPPGASRRSRRGWRRIGFDHVARLPARARGAAFLAHRDRRAPVEPAHASHAERPARHPMGRPWWSTSATPVSSRPERSQARSTSRSPSCRAASTRFPPTGRRRLLRGRLAVQRGRELPAQPGPVRHLRPRRGLCRVGGHAPAYGGVTCSAGSPRPRPILVTEVTKNRGFRPLPDIPPGV